MNDISSVLIEKDVDRLYNNYQISQELFRVHAPNQRVRMDAQIPADDIIMVYEEQLKAGLWFPMDPFFIEVLLFHKLAVAQLHPNSWRILVAFRFLCFNNNIESSITLFSQLYQLGSQCNE